MLLKIMLNFRDKIDAMPEQKRYQYYAILSCIASTLMTIVVTLFLKYGYFDFRKHKSIIGYLIYPISSMLLALFFTFLVYHYPKEFPYEYTNSDKQTMIRANIFCLLSPILAYFIRSYYFIY